MKRIHDTQKKKVPSQRHSPKDKKRIRHAFSAAASDYDRYSSLHRKVGAALIDRIPCELTPHVLLDIGMGTGRMIKLLQQRFPLTKFIGIDLSLEMLETADCHAKGVYLLQADAENLPLKQGCCDIAYSNLALQWTDKINDVFRQVNSVLAPDGRVYFSFFCRETLRELFSSIKQSENRFSAKRNLFPTRLARAEEIQQAALESGFQVEDFSCEIETRSFLDLKTLLKWLKGIGANRLNKPVFLGKTQLKQIEQYYRNNYANEAGLLASFEILTLIAKKR